MSTIIKIVQNSKMKLQKRETQAKNQAIADNIFHYYKNVGNRNKSVTTKHFMQQGIPRTSIYRIISRCLEYESPKFVIQCGGKKSKITPNIAKKVKIHSFALHPFR